MKTGLSLTSPFSSTWITAFNKWCYDHMSISTFAGMRNVIDVVRNNNTLQYNYTFYCLISIHVRLTQNNFMKEVRNASKDWLINTYAIILSFLRDHIN